jgi:hypothetical protein
VDFRSPNLFVDVLHIPPGEVRFRIAIGAGAAVPNSLLRREVPLRKRPAGAALQVTLESPGGLLIGELDNDDPRPRTMKDCLA